MVVACSLCRAHQQLVTPGRAADRWRHAGRQPLGTTHSSSSPASCPVIVHALSIQVDEEQY
jgi:hypothetical protein